MVYGDDCGAPQSFGGYSGGSVWQLLVAPDGSGGFKVVSRHLMGVPFYESDIFARDGNTVREVICHGPESIYRTLIDRMRQQSAAA